MVEENKVPPKSGIDQSKTKQVQVTLNSKDFAKNKPEPSKPQ